MAAGHELTQISRRSVWMRFTVVTVAITAVIVGTMVSENAFVRLGDWGYPDGQAYQAFSEAWCDLYGAHWMDGIGLVFFWVPVGCVSFVLLSALVHLVEVHREGPPFESYGACLRVATESLFLALVLVMALVLMAFLASGASLHGLRRRPDWEAVLVPGIPACGLILAAWTSRAIQGVGVASFSAPNSPRCEGCGYDLTHQPEDGKCPECGLALRSSLEPGFRRPGCEWERTQRARSWILTVFAVIRDPRKFYGTLKLRSPFTAPNRFGESQIGSIGIGAGLWLLGMFIFFSNRLSPGGKDWIIIPVVASWMVAFVAWGLHRLLAMVVVLDWIRKRTLTDFSWARKVFYYESAFLWVFSLFNGLFMTGVLLTNGNWLSNLIEQWLGHRLYILGLPPEPVALLMGNGFLCALWIWRYYVALAAIRWSNF